MSTVVKLSQTGNLWESPSSEWSVKDTPGIGGGLREEWANELRRDWFRGRALHSLARTNV